MTDLEHVAMTGPDVEIPTGEIIALHIEALAQQHCAADPGLETRSMTARREGAREAFALAAEEARQVSREEKEQLAAWVANRVPQEADQDVPAGEAIALQIESLRIERCARNDRYPIEQDHVRCEVESALVEAAKIARTYDDTDSR